MELTHTCTRSSNPRVSVRYTHHSPARRTLHRTALRVGSGLNSEGTRKSTKNMKNVTLRRCEKDTCIEDEAETRRQSVALFNLSWERARWATRKFFATLLVPANDCTSTSSGDLGGGGRYALSGVSEFADMDSMNHKDRRYQPALMALPLFKSLPEPDPFFL